MAFKHKQLTNVLLDSVDPDIYLCGTAHDISVTFLALEKEMQEKHKAENIRFSFYSYFDDSPEIEIYGDRIETDEELKKRIADSEYMKKIQEQKEAAEYAEYLRLKNKYE